MERLINLFSVGSRSAGDAIEHDKDDDGNTENQVKRGQIVIQPSAREPSQKVKPSHAILLSL